MMGEMLLSVRAAGPHVSVQDGGRPGLMRYGVPRSGPMDRGAFAAANIALGNPIDAAGIEISVGGLQLECLFGAASFAIAGGGFVVDHAGGKRSSWTIATLHAGETLSIRPGAWGRWCYLAFAGMLQAPSWLGSVATHTPSGSGGGGLCAGQQLHVVDAGSREERTGDISLPIGARPCGDIRVTLGPQQRFFAASALASFRSARWRVTDAGDRMGIRLAGPPLALDAALDMPSEPVQRGSVQIAGDGVATVLLADHQTTGGYPKIATILDCDVDAFVQLAPGDPVNFHPVSAPEAINLARAAAQGTAAYHASIATPRGTLAERLLSLNLIDGTVDAHAAFG